MKLLIGFFALSCCAQVIPAVSRTAMVYIAIKQQSRTVSVVTLYNDSAFQVQIPRARLLTNPAASGVAALTKAQMADQQTNGVWAVAARTGGEVVTIAPAALSAASITTKSPGYGWAGLGVSVASYLVQRAQARATAATADELPDLIPLPAYGGAEYRLHTARGAKQAAALFSLAVVVP
jgi:hypothetical protein